jgi:hypothetical protein
MGICQECKHFRRVKPASQLLAQAIGMIDAAISNALVKIQEDENQQKGYEAQTRKQREISGDKVWGFRPVMSDFCGIQEGETYIVAEIKNRGGQCNNFEHGRPEKKSCSTCAHRIIPIGTATDLEMEISLSGLAAQSVASGTSTNTPDNLLKNYREGMASRKAFEVFGVYSSKGILATKPNYLDYCGRFSFDDEYVICVLKNPHHTCSAWKEVSGTA